MLPQKLTCLNYNRSKRPPLIYTFSGTFCEEGITEILPKNMIRTARTTQLVTTGICTDCLLGIVCWSKDPFVSWICWGTPPGRGGVLPYITYTGMYRPTGSWFWSSWFRTGYPCQRRFLERGIKNCGSRLCLLLKIVADYEEAFTWCISRTNKEISF